MTTAAQARRDIRAHEIAQIRQEDIIAAADRFIICGIGKGGKPFRLPIPTDLVPELAVHLGGGKGPLWRLPPHGRPAKASDCTDQCSRLMRELGLSYTLHSLRHRYGTAFYADTHDLLLTADVMRHANTNTTRGYVETSGVAATAAMDRLASKSLRPKTTSRRTRQPREDAA